MQFKSESGIILAEYIRDTRTIPELLVSYSTQEEKGSKWARVWKRFHIGQKFTLPYSPWQDRSERYIKELKKVMQGFRTRTKSPRQLWCFLSKHVSWIQHHMAHNNITLGGDVPQA